jgi:toxin ParE1/3/4
MQLRWLDDAPADITEIYRHIAAANPRAAARVVERLQAAVRLLAEVPHRGRPGRWPGTRELVVPRTRYIVPYRVRGDRSRSSACSTVPAAGPMSRPTDADRWRNRAYLGPRQVGERRSSPRFSRTRFGPYPMLADSQASI